MSLRIRRLEPGDRRAEFRSGNLELDRFFSRYAGQNQFRHHLGTTYVAVEGDVIRGFATVTASELGMTRLPAALRKGLPAYPLPVLRLARLAVDERARGHGVARVLLRTVFALGLEMAETLGCVGIVVDAKAEAVGFYRRLGFEALELAGGELGERPQPLPMFLPLALIPPSLRREGPP